MDNIPNKADIEQSLMYWRDIAECECESEYPIGGCLKCDMIRAIRFLRSTLSSDASGWIDVNDRLPYQDGKSSIFCLGT